MRRYDLQPSYLLLFDADDERLKGLQFHIEQGDYFPFLATIIGMLGESVAQCENADEESMQAKFVEGLKKDLLYLHEHYEITPRKERLAYTKEKVVRFHS